MAAANAASYYNSGWAGLLGAVVGGVIGNAIERSATTQNGVELLLQMRNGERRSIVQANGNEGWVLGEPVVLVTTGGRARVTRAPQVGPSSPRRSAYPAPQRCRRRCRCIRNPGRCRRSARPRAQRRGGSSASPSVSSSVRRIRGQAGPPAST